MFASFETLYSRRPVMVAVDRRCASQSMALVSACALLATVTTRASGARSMAGSSKRVSR